MSWIAWATLWLVVYVAWILAGPKVVSKLKASEGVKDFIVGLVFCALTYALLHCTVWATLDK